MGNGFNTAAYDRWVNRVNRKMNEAANKVLDQAFPEFLKKVEDNVRKIFDDAITAFYHDYLPNVYDRQYDMYKLLVVDDSDQDKIAFEFRPEELEFNNRYNGEDGLYDQVFRKGWHGGADKGDYTSVYRSFSSDSGDMVVSTPHPNPGVPYWRVPVPYYTYWGRPAEIMSPSPLELIQKNIKQYESTQIMHDFKECWDRHFHNMKINW